MIPTVSTRAMLRAITTALVGVTTMAFPAVATAQTDYREHPKTPQLLETLRDDYGFDDAAIAEVREALGEARRVDKLIAQERNAPERTWHWYDYRPIHVNERNIAAGRAFIAEHADTFAAAEARWGVPAHVVAAILGAETKYGGYTGPNRILDSLATQGFDHPTRTPYFFSELAAFFALCRELGIKPTEPAGSYAGAMGLSQFMPSNYRTLSVDFDEDGDRDLWSVPDAIGSTANYLVNYRGAGRGYKRDRPVAVEASVSRPLPDDLKRNTRFPQHTVGELAEYGIRTSQTLDPDTPAGLIALQAEPGQMRYWIGLPNFYAIMSYNPRTFYAMAVYQLSEALAANDDVE